MVSWSLHGSSEDVAHTTATTTTTTTATQSVATATAADAMDKSHKNIGCHEIYKGENAKIDIVAVHGLGGDPTRTWTAPNGTCWLRDLLPAELPDSRVLSIGYNSDPAKWMEPASTNMIHHHAVTLVNELLYYRKRTNTEYRPIIFVAHSLGGLVVKRALIQANEASVNHNVQTRSIKTCTFGVIFLGTPHAGSGLAYWGSWLESVVRTVTFKSVIDTNSYLVGALKQNSETLQNVTSQFTAMAEDFRLFFFWEELPSKVAPGKTEIVVSYSSAVPESLPNAGKAAIHATHSEMCKFADAKAPGWNVLSGLLRDWAKDAWEVVRLNLLAEDARQHIDMERKIQGQISGFRHGRNSPPQSGSGINTWTGNQGPRLIEERLEQGLLTGSDDCILPNEVYEPDGTSTRRHSYTAPIVFKPATLQENTFSVDREGDLAAIHRSMMDRKSLAIIAGTGRGKTHLARQYFFDHARHYQGGVFWLECKSVFDTTGQSIFSTDLLDLQFADMAEELNIGLEEYESYGNAQDVIRKKVISWFERTENWLLVFDGVDIADDSQQDEIYRYIPKVAHRGSILMTTVNRSLAGASRLGSPDKLELEKLDVQRGLIMLFQYAQIGNPTEEDRKAGAELLEQLDFIPLMIHSAGSYIKTKVVPVAEYLRKYKRRPFVDQAIMDLAPFHAIFSRIQDKYIEAHNLLRIMAFYEQQLPLEMLTWGLKTMDEKVRLSFMTEHEGRKDFNNTIAHLLAYALVERSPRAEYGDSQDGDRFPVDTIRLHAVARDVCIARMRKESRSNLKHWLQTAIVVYCKSFHSLDERRRDGEFLLSDYMRYVVHGRSLVGYAEKYGVSTTDIGGENLLATLQKATDLSNGGGETHGVPRRSMFRTGSMTDSSSLDSPVSERSRTYSFNILPVELRSQSPHSGDEDLQQFRIEAHKEFEENLKQANSEKPRFRYHLKGRRPTHDRERGSDWGSLVMGSPNIPTSHVFLEDVFSHRGRVSGQPPGPIELASDTPRGSPDVKAALEAHLQRDASVKATKRKTVSDDAVPETLPTRASTGMLGRWVSPTHSNPLSAFQTPVTRTSTFERPIPHRLRSGSLPTQHSTSAPAELGIRPNYNASSPTLAYPPEFPLGGGVQAIGRPHAPFMSPTPSMTGSATAYIPMPPYPVTPTAEVADPWNTASGQNARPYSHGQSPSNDTVATRSTMLSAREQLSSSVSSEPIFEDADSQQSSTPRRRDVSGSPLQRPSPMNGPSSRPGTRSPSPYALFSLEGAARRPLSSGSGGPRRFPQTRAVGEHASAFRPPPSPSQNPRIIESPASNSSPGLGIGNVVFPFETHPHDDRGHTRHASVGETPRVGGGLGLGLRLNMPNSPLNPTRRGSVPNNSGMGSVEMGRSRSEPGKAAQGNPQARPAEMPGSWSIAEVNKDAYSQQGRMPEG